MKRLISILTVFGLTVFLATGKASANIEYKFSGVTFADGGTLTGTFTTNDPISALVDFDITTSAGTNIGHHYTSANTPSSSTALPYIIVLADLPGLDNLLQVSFDGLSAIGGPIKIGAFDSFEQTPLLRRDIVAGEVTVVPEPETYAVLLAGLGLVGFIARRKKPIF